MLQQLARGQGRGKQSVRVEQGKKKKKKKKQGKRGKKMKKNEKGQL